MKKSRLPQVALLLCIAMFCGCGTNKINHPYADVKAAMIQLGEEAYERRPHDEAQSQKAGSLHPTERSSAQSGVADRNYTTLAPQNKSVGPWRGLSRELNPDSEFELELRGDFNKLPRFVRFSAKRRDANSTDVEVRAVTSIWMFQPKSVNRPLEKYWRDKLIEILDEREQGVTK